MKRVIVAARVSTDAQAEHGRSIDTQIEAGRRYAAEHGFEVVAEIIDTCSGTIPIRERPGGRQIYDLIDRRAADALIFYTVDRATRDEDMIEIATLRRDVRLAGMELHYVDAGQADLSTLGGIVDTIKAAVAAEERKKIIERNTRGKRAKVEAGHWVGTGAEPFGYRKQGKGQDAHLVIHEGEAAVVRRIFDLYVGTGGQLPLSIWGIAAVLNAEGVKTPARPGRPGRPAGRYWRSCTVYFILKQRTYIGEIHYGEAVGAAPELAIVDAELFDQAQARMKVNGLRARRNRNRDYLLVARIRCACGRAMTARARKGKYLYYACSCLSIPPHARTCHEQSVRADRLDADVWVWLSGLLRDDEHLNAGLDRLAEREAAQLAPKRDQLAKKREKIAQAERRVGRFVAQYSDATKDELKALRAQVREESRKLDDLRAECARLEADLEQGDASATDRARILADAAELRECLEDPDAKERAYILDRLNLRCAMRRDEGGALVADVSCMLAGREWPIAPHASSVIRITTRV
jgi:site-specific DNA recombinase